MPQPLKNGSVTPLSCSNVVATHPENLSRNHFLISNRRSNTRIAYVVLGSTDPVSGGLCTFSLAPNEVYERGAQDKPYVGPIKVILDGAGPEFVDITEQT